MAQQNDRRDDTYMKWGQPLRYFAYRLRPAPEHWQLTNALVIRLRPLSNQHNHYATTYVSGVKVKSGVSEVSSSGNLIDLCHLDSIFKFDSGYQFGEVIETA